MGISNEKIAQLFLFFRSSLERFAAAVRERFSDRRKIFIRLGDKRRRFFEEMKLHPAIFLSSAVVIAAAATVLSLYTLGAEVRYDGQSLGVVSSRHAAEKVVAELEDITGQMLACGADITQINTIRKRLSGVKGGRFAQRCAPAQVFSIVLSDILGDPLDMIASGPAAPDSSTCAQALAAAEKYHLGLSAQAWALLAQETPKTLDNVTTRITGSVRELCRAAASACRNLGYEPVLLTDQLCCEAREAGSFLGSIVRTQAGQGKKLAYIAGGETIVHLTGKGLGGRNQELALAAAPAIAGLNAAVFSVGSDGTDGPTDAAGGYVDGDTLAALEAGGWSGYAALQNNDSYHALKAVDGLIITGATGTNVNDVAVALIGEKTPPVSPEVSPEW